MEEVVFDKMKTREKEHDESRLFIFDRKDQNIIGDLLFLVDDSSRDRLSFYMSPDYRQQGLAREAYIATISRCIEQGVFHQLYAQVELENKASQQFLKSLGFQETGKDTNPFNGKPTICFQNNNLQELVSRYNSVTQDPKFSI